MNSTKKVILIILDGFGLPTANHTLSNAIQKAKTPTLDMMFEKYPHSILHTSGEYVGLNTGQMGNSEIGHLNLGSGRIIYSDILRIDKALEDKSFIENNVLNSAISSTTKKIHLVGLLSDGGVHSHISHLKKMLQLFSARYPTLECYIHGFLDGRDTSPKSGIAYIQEIQQFTEDLNYGKLSSVIGRYYAMDRDNRWDRIQKAYHLLVHGDGTKSSNIISTIKSFYEKNITDEFMEPIVCNEGSSIKDGDLVLFFNFRADRARQLTEVFSSLDFKEFPTTHSNINWLCLTEYQKEVNKNILFPKIKLNNLLGEVIANHQLKQLRLAETEKYAHVTFFFNGGEEEAFPNEKRILIESPKVATYDLCPEMSAYQIKDTLLKEVKKNEFDFIVVNFANGDMVGHTGNVEATIKAVECLDNCLKEIFDNKQNYTIFITADHGNCEQMLAEDLHTPFTQHTTLPVPFIMISNSKQQKVKLKDGKLADVAPTILEFMELPIPKEITGNLLIQKK